MRTANPALRPSTFADIRVGTEGAMTVSGTVNRTGILFLLLLATASFVWSKFYTVGPQAAMPWMIGGGIGGFIVAIVTIFKKTWAAWTAPMYALLEGLLLGGLSSYFEAMYPGIVIQATGLTFMTLFSMLFLYRSGVIKVTDKFRMGVAAATGAIFLVYMISFVMSFFGAQIPMIHEGGTIGIGFSLLVVGIAALNLVLDFDLIEQLARRGAPKHMEWYGAFALMVTLVWLYIELLRLLAKTRGRR